jgi:hypothetical protein
LAARRSTACALATYARTHSRIVASTWVTTPTSGHPTAAMARTVGASNMLLARCAFLARTLDSPWTSPLVLAPRPSPLATCALLSAPCYSGKWR